MLQECLVGFRRCNRYVAHSKIDDALRAFPRDGLRSWHTSLVQCDTDMFRGVIRTKDAAVVTALPDANWREMVLPGIGDEVVSFVEITPKKPKHFSSFRIPYFATQYVNSRLLESEAFEDFTSEYLASSLIDIQKSTCAYSAPTAWFRVTGRVKSVEAFEHLVLQGIGGSHAFGVGMFNPSSSSLHQMAKTVAGAHAGTTFN